MEAINARRLDGLAELVTPGFVRHDCDGLAIDRRGPESLVELARLLLGALPDLHLQVSDVFATEDRAAVYLRITGTHRGEFLGLSPSGRSVCVDSIDLYRLEGNKIAEAWPWPDLAGIRRQMAEEGDNRLPGGSVRQPPHGPGAPGGMVGVRNLAS